MPTVHVLDTHQLGTSGIIAATAVESRDGLILFDTGPESTFDHVAAELARIGFAAADVRHVFLSHIHFDHAGAAWRFAELGAVIYVHPRGAPHLIDPSKLIVSAERIFGDNMQRLWGRIAPVPGQNVRVLHDGEVVHVPPFEVRAIETPGHASHHNVYVWEDNLFGGDIAGVRLGHGPPIPPFVPPELHIESWLESLEKIRAANPVKLYLPHFGLVPDSIPAHLDAMEERVSRWSAWFLDRIHAGADEPRLIREFARYEKSDLLAGGADEALVGDYETADPSYMAIPAAFRYWRKHHPEQLSR
jgi:glyoxylase-like metal-dependent hydrolase (beta-lactamase superfamily II)